MRRVLPIILVAVAFAAGPAAAKEPLHAGMLMVCGPIRIITGWPFLSLALTRNELGITCTSEKPAFSRSWRIFCVSTPGLSLSAAGLSVFAVDGAALLLP